MSTEFFIREKKPTIKKQWFIGKRANQEFYSAGYSYLEDEKLTLPNKEMLLEFIRGLKNYDIVDEYDREYTKEQMIEIIKEEQE